jgi:hypothetical protein
VLGVPLITVPDSSPPSLEGSVGTRLEALPHFFARGPTFLGYTLFRWVFWGGGGGSPPPPGVAPEASEEWFDSSDVLMLFVMLQPAWLFPHAVWP